jgi:hypothetical protein
MSPLLSGSSTLLTIQYYLHVKIFVVVHSSLHHSSYLKNYYIICFVSDFTSKYYKLDLSFCIFLIKFLNETNGQTSRGKVSRDKYFYMDGVDKKYIPFYLLS